MADIVDSLKRLERVGTESSKTNQKLIEAARELAQKIVDQFDPHNETIEIDRRYDDDDATKRPFHYTISCRSGSGELLNSSGQSVAHNRDNAVRFADDLADGLLDFVNEILEKRYEESKKALATIEDAGRKSSYNQDMGTIRELSSRLTTKPSSD